MGTNKKLLVSLFVVYIVNTISKTSFSASTVALVAENILTKTQAGLIGGVFWLIYALGQIIGGIAVKKISPTVMMNITIIGSAITHVAMACFDSFVPLMIIWSINSICQFGIWPSILKIVSTEVEPRLRITTMSMLSYSYCIGAIISYALTTVVLATLPWKNLYIICGGLIALSMIPAGIIRKNSGSHLLDAIPEQHNEHKEKARLTKGLMFKNGFVFICVLMFIKSTMDNGIKSWMPTLMAENFGVTPAYTTLLSVFMLIINTFGVVMCTYIYKKTKNDYATSLLVMYIFAVPVVFAWINFESLNVYVVTILMSLVNILFYASGQILQMIYPLKFESYGLTAVVGAFINCFSALGNVAATYGCGFVADSFGWNTLIYTWIFLVVVSAVITIFLVTLSKRYKNKTD